MNTKELKRLIDNEIGSRPEAIEDILEAVSESIYKTAEHLRGNWQDEKAARAWEAASEVIEQARIKVSRHI
jgi:hypothetical protein